MFPSKNAHFDKGCGIISTTQSCVQISSYGKIYLINKLYKINRIYNTINVFRTMPITLRNLLVFLFFKGLKKIMISNIEIKIKNLFNISKNDFSGQALAQKFNPRLIYL